MGIARDGKTKIQVTKQRMSKMNKDFSKWNSVLPAWPSLAVFDEGVRSPLRSGFRSSSKPASTRFSGNDFVTLRSGTGFDVVRIFDTHGGGFQELFASNAEVFFEDGGVSRVCFKSLRQRVRC